MKEYKITLVFSESYVAATALQELLESCHIHNSDLKCETVKGKVYQEDLDFVESIKQKYDADVMLTPIIKLPERESLPYWQFVIVVILAVAAFSCFLVWRPSLKSVNLATTEERLMEPGVTYTYDGTLKDEPLKLYYVVERTGSFHLVTKLLFAKEVDESELLQCEISNNSSRERYVFPIKIQHNDDYTDIGASQEIRNLKGDTYSITITSLKPEEDLSYSLQLSIEESE